MDVSACLELMLEQLITKLKIPEESKPTPAHFIETALLWLPPVRYLCTKQTHYHLYLYHITFTHCFNCGQGTCSPLVADAYLCPNQKHSVKYNCCSKAHFSIQTGNWNSFETLVLLASFNRVQLSAPRSTSKISISCSALPQTHIHAAPFTISQPNLKSVKAKHIQQLFPFKMPFVIQIWGWCTWRR